jgi:Ca2+-binding EF-hand superfamily protein
LPTQESEIYFKIFDRDNKGSLGYKELSILELVTEYVGSYQTLMNFIFKIIDENEDNIVDIEKLETILKVIVY